MLTATVVDQFGDPATGRRHPLRRRRRRAPVPATGDGLTDVDVESLSFTFTSSIGVTNTIPACVDRRRLRL